MTFQARWRRWPLFGRVFAWMLVTVLLVQVLNFVLVLVVRPPMPDIQPVERIATALATGKDTSGTLRIWDDSSVPQLSTTQQDSRFARRLAAEMSLPFDAVRVTTSDPLPPGLRAPFQSEQSAPRDGRSVPSQFAAGTDDLIFGPFTASVRQANGRWRSASPATVGLAPWRSRVLLWLVVAILVVAPFAWLLARRVARPIALFATAAERLGRDPRAPPLPIVGPSEVIEAATAFNEMQARLNGYVQDRTTLLAAIAHDLRTPLMRLTMRLERAPAELRVAAEEDIHEMNQRIASVMAFVRDMNRPTRRQKLNLRFLAQSVTDDFADQGAAVTLEDGGSIIMTGDPPALKALFANLISNAVKYGGSARVSCTREQESAKIEVVDSGQGMAEEDLAAAFEPFFRAERSRGRETGGIGLGLASVRAVARAHGGDATLENRPDGGLRACVILPI